jgi:hypothetical protein
VSKLIKIGIPVIIVLLMLVVVGTGIVLARENNNVVSTGSSAAYAGNSNGNWAGCWNNGGYCPGPCGRGTSNGDNPSGNLPSCCRSY